jgi:hypothetical protein
LKEDVVVDDGLVTLRIYGLEKRSGRVPTEAFTGIIRRFAATMAIFERAYTAQRVRSTDLNVTTLARENPLLVGLRPEPRVRGYLPGAAVSWAFSEIEKVGRGQPLDRRVPFDALDNIVTLSDKDDDLREELAAFAADYGTHHIGFDQNLAVAAKAQRLAALASLPAPTWFAGTSKGTLLGELRGAMDLGGEREFFVRTISGNRRVKCVFPESIRSKMNGLLWRPVRIEGFLHYDGSSPQAYLVEAIDIVDLNEDERPHLYDNAGLFADSEYPQAPEWSQ